MVSQEKKSPTFSFPAQNTYHNARVDCHLDQEVNEGEEEVVWIITWSGSEPVVVNLEGWGGTTKK